LRFSVACCCSFLDTYFEADLKAGRITEPEVQELIDQFVMKMRIVRYVIVFSVVGWCDCS
jgi:formate C-acetyltransferase